MVIFSCQDVLVDAKSSRLQFNVFFLEHVWLDFNAFDFYGIMPYSTRHCTGVIAVKILASGPEKGLKMFQVFNLLLCLVFSSCVPFLLVVCMKVSDRNV